MKLIAKLIAKKCPLSEAGCKYLQNKYLKERLTGIGPASLAWKTVPLFEHILYI